MVPHALIVALACLAYLAASALLARAQHQELNERSQGPWLAIPAMGLHLGVHLLAWRGMAGPDLQLFAALSLVGVGMAILTTFASFAQRIEALGVVVYPLAATTLAIYALAGPGRASNLDWPLQLHASLALIAYATLALSALLAVMLSVQEKALRKRRLHGWWRALPPMTQLETLLFRSLGAGFFLLSLALLTGVVFVDDLFAQHLAHKTVLSLLSWVVLALLLFGRWRWGWRGPRAVKLTLVAMALLLLAFFGSKYVYELVLHRD